ncbi:outer membrane protein assembly factor BamD [Motiliproteus sp. SC1-56]|uniref:outer membrane protein assembly factor BamD n=1 Tax=Motiliproteus sp. SC1-56 TaxID=2799565 RepID=UPI001A8D7834|nr:outer membrane protein assembly factor BamD [Motiliproteus sp. SC1-56]
MRTLRSSLLITLFGLLGGCSLFGIDSDSFDIPEPQLYAEAMEAMELPNYQLAIDKLEQLESRYPFGRYSEQAQLELIFAYYKTSQTEQTKAAADRFIRLHPDHENIDYAYYLRGLANFEADSDLLDRWLPTDASQRDPGAARDSFNDFSTLTSRYPNSQYAPDARQRMLFLRNQLAAYEIHVARYYMKRNAYIAAANRGRYVVENYQQTPSVPAALAIMVAAYEELGMNDLAADSRAVLAKNFPGYAQAFDEL